MKNKASKAVRQAIDILLDAEGLVLSKAVKDIREATGLSQKQFATTYDIPIHTLQNWEQGVYAPPKYVVKILSRVVRYDVDVMNDCLDAHLLVGGVSFLPNMIKAPLIQEMQEAIQHGVTFKEFCDDYGWKDWMNMFLLEDLEDADDYEPTESEFANIDQTMKEAWNEALEDMEVGHEL